MWIVGHDITYYPSIYKFEKEEDAREEYKSIKEDIEAGEYPEEQCVFIAEVKDFIKGKKYEMIDDKMNKEL